MKEYRIAVRLLAVFVLHFGATIKLSAQNHADEIIQTTVDKVTAINDKYWVLEKSFSDNIYASDSVLTNCIYKHNFSFSNTYHLNAYASREDVSDISVFVIKYDANNKPQLVSKDNLTSNDVDFVFKPSVSGRYWVVVKAILKTGITSCFFNLLISRE